VKVLVIETQPMVPIGTFGPPLVAAGLELVYWRTHEGAPPSSLAEFAGVVALGGAANPDEGERYPWLAAERELLASAVGRRMPTVGLCLGGELLAEVLGGSLLRLPRPEIGWVELEQKPAARGDGLAPQLPRRFDVFHWHGFAFGLPPGASLLAGSRHRTQAFGFGGFAWGFQFHLEADERIICDWIAHYGDVLGEQGLDPRRLLGETRERAPSYRRHAAAFARAFAALIHDRARAGIG
jgi:GMP synthase-like glutamine amidotransferase